MTNRQTPHPAMRPRHAQPHWQIPWLQLVACLVVLAGTTIFLYPHAASWFSQKEQSRVMELAQESMQQPPYNDQKQRDDRLARAHAYNAALASGALLKANANVAVGDGSSANESLLYEEMLAITDAGFMGRLQYETLAIDLPIYHGTSDATLAKGIGHLEGTSLPVGGIGTRSVLTAHRGLPSATLFNNLDDAAVGDTFTVSVLDQVLLYRVIETQVIEPSETKAIIADPDRDLVTLITCTPLGINSHRILVTGERVTPTPVTEIAYAAAKPDLPGFPWWAVILGSVVVVLTFSVWRAGYPPQKASQPARRG